MSENKRSQLNYIQIVHNFEKRNNKKLFSKSKPEQELHKQTTPATAHILLKHQFKEEKQ